MHSYAKALSVILVFLAGCQSDRTKAYPVSGVVVLENGQPATDLAGGMVTFSSSELKTSSIVEIGIDGTFQLTTLRQGDGAVPGTYEVAVESPTPETGDRKVKQVQTVPRYVCVQSQVTVEPKRNEIRLTVRKAAAAKGS